MLSPIILIRILTIPINKTSSNQSCWWFNQEFSVLLNKWGTLTGIKPGLYNSAFPQHGSPDVLVDTQLRSASLLRKILITWKFRVTWKILSVPFYEGWVFFFLIPLLILEKVEGFSCQSHLLNGKPLHCLCQQFISHVFSPVFSSHMWNNVLASGKQNIYSKEKETCVFYLKWKDTFYEIILPLKWIIKAKRNKIS